MRFLFWLAFLFAVFALPAAAQKPGASSSVTGVVVDTHGRMFRTDVPFVPAEVLDARTIAVVVYWPDAGWRDKAEVQGDGENFLRKWKRYKIVRLAEHPDLIALVVVEPTGRSGGFWRTLAYALSVGAQAYARSAQNYEHCQSEINGSQVGNSENYQVDTSCYGYTPGTATAQSPPPPSYVLGGTILLFDGKFLGTNAPIPEPLLFADADNHGRMPLIGAAKRLRKMIEEAQKDLSDRMAIVNALAAKIHELAVADSLPASDEATCDVKISQQIGADEEMLGRLEQRDFTDVEPLFQKLCKPAGSN